MQIGPAGAACVGDAALTSGGGSVLHRIWVVLGEGVRLSRILVVGERERGMGYWSAGLALRKSRGVRLGSDLWACVEDFG